MSDKIKELTEKVNEAEDLVKWLWIGLGNMENKTFEARKASYDQYEVVKTRATRARLALEAEQNKEGE